MRLRTTMGGPRMAGAVEIDTKVYPIAARTGTRRPLVRFMIAIAFAAIVLIPASAPVQAAGAPELSAVSDLSSSHTKKHKPKRKAAKKEEYLRDVPSTPPAGAKQ